MKKIQIRGGRALRGSVPCAGMKNAAVAVIFATILTADRCILENLPAISDVDVALSILQEMGAQVLWLDEQTVRIDTESLTWGGAPAGETGKMRASYYLVGAELGRFGRTRVGYPGGCDFVERPIDQHLKAFAALGADLTAADGVIAGRGKLKGGRVEFDTVSVGATINALLAAVLAEGETLLVGVAKEPHIVDVATFLIACGAQIEGAGTDTIRVRGVPALHGCVHRIVPDMIEAGTYLIAAAATGGTVRVTGVIPAHLTALTQLLSHMGVAVVEGADEIEVSATLPLRGVSVETAPYPGFATDLQPQMGALLAMAEGGGVLTERVWDHRFRYAKELAKLGARVEVDGNRAIFSGGDNLHGAPARAVDLRAGAALIVAGLAADGVTTISGVEHIERGYGDIVGKLTALGADIR